MNQTKQTYGCNNKNGKRFVPGLVGFLARQRESIPSSSSYRIRQAYHTTFVNPIELHSSSLFSFNSLGINQITKIPRIPKILRIPAFPKNFIHPINTETIVINKTNCQPIVIHCLTKKNPVADLHDEKIFFARNLPRIDGCIDFFCTFTQILNEILKR